MAEIIQFPRVGAVKAITPAELGTLATYSLQHALTAEAEGIAVRKLIRSMLPLLKAADLIVMHRKIVQSGLWKEKAWGAFADELDNELSKREEAL